MSGGAQAGQGGMPQTQPMGGLGLLGQMPGGMRPPGQNRPGPGGQMVPPSRMDPNVLQQMRQQALQNTARQDAAANQVTPQDMQRMQQEQAQAQAYKAQMMANPVTAAQYMQGVYTPARAMAEQQGTLGQFDQANNWGGMNNANPYAQFQQRMKQPMPSTGGGFQGGSLWNEQPSNVMPAGGMLPVGGLLGLRGSMK